MYLHLYFIFQTSHFIQFIANKYVGFFSEIHYIYDDIHNIKSQKENICFASENQESSIHILVWQLEFFSYFHLRVLAEMMIRKVHQSKGTKKPHLFQKSQIKGTGAFLARLMMQLPLLYYVIYLYIYTCILTQYSNTLTLVSMYVLQLLFFKQIFKVSRIFKFPCSV